MAIEAFVELSKDDAVEHLRAAAWALDIATCGYTGCEEHRGPSEQKRIHSLLGGLGADRDLEDAERRIRTADLVGWVPQSLFNHELYVLTPEGREYHYEVRKPKEPVGLPEVGNG